MHMRNNLGDGHKGGSLLTLDRPIHASLSNIKSRPPLLQISRMLYIIISTHNNVSALDVMLYRRPEHTLHSPNMRLWRQ